MDPSRPLLHFIVYDTISNTQTAVESHTASAVSLSASLFWEASPALQSDQYALRAQAARDTAAAVAAVAAETLCLLRAVIDTVRALSAANPVLPNSALALAAEVTELAPKIPTPMLSCARDLPGPGPGGGGGSSSRNSSRLWLAVANPS